MKKTIKLLTVITIMLILIISIQLQVFAVTEQDRKDLQNKIDDAKNQLNTITDNKDNAQSELESLTNKVAEAQNELEKIKAELEDVNSKISEKESQIEEEEKEIEAKNNLLKQRMVALYEAGDTSFLDVIFNSESLLDFFSNYSMIQQIVQSDSDLIDDLEKKKQGLEKDKAELEEQKQEVENLKSEQEIKSSQLRVLQQTKKEEINKLTAEEKKTQEEIDSYNEAMAAVNKALAEAAKKAEEQIKNSTGGNGLKFDGSFIWPCNNKVVTSTVKKRWGRMHKGIDIGASYESVYASASGYAYNAYDRNGYGVYIMIFHGDNYVTLYGHLNSSHVSDGQYVKQGQVIATSGNSGGSTGAHLHFEIRQASNISQFFSKSPLNPLDYLPGGYTLAAGATTES